MKYSSISYRDKSLPLIASRHWPMIASRNSATSVNACRIFAAPMMGGPCPGNMTSAPSDACATNFSQEEKMDKKWTELNPKCWNAEILVDAPSS